MPTVDCDHDDCKHYGKRDGICIKRRIRWQAGQCLDYTPKVERDLMRTFNPGCRKTQSGYKSIRTGIVLK